MYRQKKQLEREIATAVNHLMAKQMNYLQHKDYFKNGNENPKYGFLLLLLPAFIKGWQYARKRNKIGFLKQSLKLMLAISASFMRKRLKLG